MEEDESEAKLVVRRFKNQREAGDVRQRVAGTFSRRTPSSTITKPPVFTVIFDAITNSALT